MEVWPGTPYPLGAIFDGTGTNFSVFSEAAERVELCLFEDAQPAGAPEPDRGDAAEEIRLNLPEQTAYCFHGYVPNVRPGRRYGFRVYGPYDAARGLRCNPAKLLLDPYAKAIEGTVRWNGAIFPYALGSPNLDLVPELTDSGPFVPKAVVSDPWFQWGDDRRLAVPWHDTVIYEVHVKGFTQRHPEIPPELRGTYAGLATPEAIAHFQRLGVTAVELLPVHQFVRDHGLAQRGLRNYWGYNSIGYFAPHNEYSSSGHRGQQVQEFKRMVKTLHSAGIEVILDVVYNHTAEGNHLGPALCFRGLDNLAYYRTVPHNPRFYMDYTGTGNSLNMRHPHVLQMIMDSLRYWVLEMHVDGFRFDLAATLARELHDVDRLSAFFDLVQQDPVLSQVKLIAEPWDVGEGGYQVGNFPVLWSEWNGKYRDTVRDYWRGESAAMADFAARLTGSSDLYQDDGRRPYASVNFVTCHDGFTLEDLVTYNDKHNEANGEDNHDGESYNRSWNCGVEGPTDDPLIRSLRDRQRRNLLATLLLSQGVPMLLGGDELGRTQRGNNNAYCQDNEVSWFDWRRVDRDLLAFVERLVAFRREHPAFRRRRWFQGRPILGEGLTDIAWFRPDGNQMTEHDWRNGYAKSLAVFLNGEEIASPDPRGRRVRDDSFFILFNAHFEPIRFTLPRGGYGQRWSRTLDTADPLPRFYRAGGQVPVSERSLVVLKREA
jgi:isoamylase